MGFIDPNPDVRRGSEFVDTLEGVQNRFRGLTLGTSLSPPIARLFAGKASMLQANPFAEKAKTTIVAGAKAGRPTLFSMLVVNHAVYRERFNLRKFLGPFDEGVGAGVLAKPNGARKLKAAFRAGQ